MVDRNKLNLYKLKEGNCLAGVSRIFADLLWTRLAPAFIRSRISSAVSIPPTPINGISPRKTDRLRNNQMKERR